MLCISVFKVSAARVSVAVLYSVALGLNVTADVVFFLLNATCLILVMTMFCSVCKLVSR